MARGSDDRAVSEVVGFMLIFGMVVIAFTIYQGIVVPEQNRQVEFQHSQAVQGEFQDLRNAIVGTARSGSGESVSITLGAAYPRRTIAQNLGTSAGAVGTGPPEPLRVSGVTAIDDEASDYVAGTLGPFDTRSLRYRPVYSFYGDAPVTVYENTVAYNRFDAANVTMTDQVMIDGRRITLVALAGDLAEASQGTVSVSTEAVSQAATPVAVRNATGAQLTITVPTALPLATWEELLAEERVANGGYVEAIQPVAGADAVRVTLRDDVVYELRLAKVGVGAAPAEEPAKYLTAVEGDGTSVPEGGSQVLVVEARDRFNNPASNVTITASVAGVGTVTTSPLVTDGSGRARFGYEAPDDVSGTEDVDVTVAFDGDGTANETATFDLDVIDTDGSGGSGGGGADEINPADQGDVRLVDEESSNEVATLSLDNTAGSPVNLTAARLNFYLENNNQEVAVAEIADGGTVSATLEVGGGFEALSPEIELPADATSDVEVRFYRDATKTQTKNINSGEFFVLTVTYSNGETDTYFVAP